jgi:hypothetical protein
MLHFCINSWMFAFVVSALYGQCLSAGTPFLELVFVQICIVVLLRLPFSNLTILEKCQLEGGGMAELVARPPTVLKVRGSNHGAD